MVLKRKVKAVASAITAFDIGPAGHTLALGTSEGALWTARGIAHMISAVCTATLTPAALVSMILPPVSPQAAPPIRDSLPFTAAGEVHAWSTDTLSRRRRERQAHMVFATAVAVPPGERALVSVSADASACVLGVGKRRKRSGSGWLVPLLVLLLAAIVYYVMHVRGVDMRWSSVRRLLRELRDPYSPSE